MDYNREEMVPRLCALLRVVFAWFMLWPFFDKLFGLGFQTQPGLGMIDGGSPSAMVIYVTDGLLKDFWLPFGGNVAVDYLMMIGLLAIGITLLLGIASRVCCISFTVFLLCMYSLVLPPTDNPFIDYRITWIIGLWIIYFADGFKKYSLAEKWSQLPIVKDCKWLQ